MAERKENRGGKREGAGRKPIFDLSDSERLEVIKDVKAMAEKNKTSIGKELGNMMFGRNKDKRLKAQSIRMFLNDVLAKSSEQEINVNHTQKPQIYIPEELPDSDEAGDAQVTH